MLTLCGQPPVASYNHLLDSHCSLRVRLLNRPEGLLAKNWSTRVRRLPQLWGNGSTLLIPTAPPSACQGNSRVEKAAKTNRLSTIPLPQGHLALKLQKLEPKYGRSHLYKQIMQAKARQPRDGTSGKGRIDENTIEKASLDRPRGIDSDGSALRECPGFKQNEH